VSENPDRATLIALFVCDEIELEKDGHKTARHMMSHLSVDRVPATRKFTIFARYTAPIGPLRVNAEIVDPQGAQIWHSDAVTRTVNPGGTVDEYIRRASVTLNHIGDYEVRLIVNEQIAGCAPLHVLQSPPFVHLVDRSRYCGSSPEA
jgi:hypothetical protein